MLLLCLLSFSPLWVRADQRDHGDPIAVAPWLKVSNDPRVAAMGGAGVGLAAGAGALELNPAGLAGQGLREVSLGHNAWMQDSSLEHLTYAAPWKNWGVAAGLNYLNFGSIARYSLDSTGQPVADGSLTPLAGTFSLGAGKRAWPNVSYGMSLKLVAESLQGTPDVTYAADLGTVLKTPLRHLTAGFAAQNLGESLEGGALPVNFKSGLGYQKSTLQGDFALAGDVNVQSGDQARPVVSLGGEYWYAHTVAGRLGYKTGSLPAVSNQFSAGLGFRYRALELGYAYTGMGELQGGNQVSMDYRY
jgi:hypothetical protein